MTTSPDALQRSARHVTSAASGLPLAAHMCSRGMPGSRRVLEAVRFGQSPREPLGCGERLS